jgi:N-acetylmuramoyl-L-alanine amidase
MVEITQDFLNVGARNRPGRPMFPKYITVHNTDNENKGADSIGHAAYLKGGSAGSTGWHFTVDDKRIVQHIPCNENAYHAADGANGPGNTTSIGIEICVNSDGDYAKAETNAIDLIRYLMNEYKIPIENVVPHKHWYNKNCPSRILPRWDSFIHTIQAGSKPDPFAAAPEWARASLNKAMNKKAVSDPNGDLTFYRMLVVLDKLSLLD